MTNNVRYSLLWPNKTKNSVNKESLSVYPIKPITVSERVENKICIDSKVHSCTLCECKYKLNSCYPKPEESLGHLKYNL